MWPATPRARAHTHTHHTPRARQGTNNERRTARRRRWPEASIGTRKRPRPRRRGKKGNDTGNRLEEPTAYSSAAQREAKGQGSKGVLSSYSGTETHKRIYPSYLGYTRLQGGQSIRPPHKTCSNAQSSRPTRSIRKSYPQGALEPHAHTSQARHSRRRKAKACVGKAGLPPTQPSHTTVDRLTLAPP